MNFKFQIYFLIIALLISQTAQQQPTNKDEIKLKELLFLRETIKLTELKIQEFE